MSFVLTKQLYWVMQLLSSYFLGLCQCVLMNCNGHAYFGTCLTLHLSYVLPYQVKLQGTFNIHISGTVLKEKKMFCVSGHLSVWSVNHTWRTQNYWHTAFSIQVQLVLTVLCECADEQVYMFIFSMFGIAIAKNNLFSFLIEIV